MTYKCPQLVTIMGKEAQTVMNAHPWTAWNLIYEQQYALVAYSTKSNML